MLQSLSPQDQANILGGTFARLHGLDIEALKAGIAGDEFARAPGEAPKAPFSTIGKELAHG